MGSLMPSSLNRCSALCPVGFLVFLAARCFISFPYLEVAVICRADDNTSTSRKQSDEGIGNTLVSGPGSSPCWPAAARSRSLQGSRTIKNQDRNVRRYHQYFCPIVFLSSRWLNRERLLSARKERTWSRRKQQSSPERSKESAPGSSKAF